MTVSSTTLASGYPPWQSIYSAPSPKGNCLLISSVTFSYHRQGLSVRSSGDMATTESGEEGSYVEVPEERPSLISALNVEKALRGMAITDADHYARLEIPRKCPYDEVIVAYNQRVEEAKNAGLEEEELNKRLELLKESHEILSSAEERRMYDWSLARSERPDRYSWPFEVDITPPTRGTPPQEEEDVGPTRLVGYFMLGWLILSFALSIALNR